jgi:hypothetical protein
MTVSYEISVFLYSVPGTYRTTEAVFAMCWICISTYLNKKHLNPWHYLILKWTVIQSSVISFNTKIYKYNLHVLASTDHHQKVLHQYTLHVLASTGHHHQKVLQHCREIHYMYAIHMSLYREFYQYKLRLDLDIIFNWPNPSSHTMVLGSTQPLTEMSIRNLPGGKRQ